MTRPRRRRRWPALAALASAALFASSLSLSAGAASSGWAPAGALAGLGMGRIWQVAFAPVTPGLAAAATDQGVYISTDGGQTWTLSALRGVGVWSVAFDPSTSPETIYAGLRGTPGQASGGVRVSQDGGETWSDISSGLPSRDVRCLVITPAGIAAGTGDGVALSTDGRSWSSDGLQGDSVSAITAVTTAKATTLYAGIDYPVSTAGYLYSLDASGGGSWTALTHGLPRGAVVNSISAGPTSQAVPVSPLLVTTSSGAYWSANAGSTWSESGGVSGATLTDAVYSPRDPNLVYAGADAGGSSGGGLWRSTDTGQTFTGFTQGLPTTHPAAEAPLLEVESLAVSAGPPYPTVIAALDPYQQPAAIYHQVDASAPSPPAPASPSGSASASATAAATASAPATSAAVGPVVTRPGPTPTPSPTGLQSVADSIFHFPLPLVFWILFVLVVAFIWVRWRRHYEVEGPP